MIPLTKANLEKVYAMIPQCQINSCVLFVGSNLEYAAKEATHVIIYAWDSVPPPHPKIIIEYHSDWQKPDDWYIQYRGTNYNLSE